MKVKILIIQKKVSSLYDENKVFKKNTLFFLKNRYKNKA